MAMVLDPRTGKMVEDGRPRVNPNAPNIGLAVGDTLAGTLGAPVGYGVGAVQAGVAQLLGGQVPDPYARGRAQVDRAAGGLSVLADASRETFSDVQGAALGLVGAERVPTQPTQPAVPQTAASTTPAATPPIAASAPTTQAPDPFVGASDARIAAIANEARTPVGVDTAAINRGLAERITASRPEAAIYQPQARGDFNMYNTDQTALATRAAPTNGINFGFGVGGSPTASEYLDTMRQQDLQESQMLQQRRMEADAGVARIGLRTRMESDDPFVRRAARQEMEALDNRVGMGVEQTGETQRQGMQGRTSERVARTQGQFGLGQATINAEGGIAQQQIASAQRAAEAEATLAQDQMQFEQDPVAQRAAVANQLAEAALRAGDFQGAISALYGTQPAGTPKPTVQELETSLGQPLGRYINGQYVPLTPDELASIMATTAAYNQPTQ